MRLTYLPAVVFSGLTLCVVGCGGDDGGGVSVPDAAVKMDAAVDAPPAGLTGLGQTCVVAMQGADCPTNAPGCLSYAQGATKGICTNLCVMNGSFMTDAQAMPVAASFNPNPTTKDATCVALYTGGAQGTPTCSALTRRVPTGNLAANTTYMFDMACEVSCGTGNTCPAGLTCDTNFMSCVPM